MGDDIQGTDEVFKLQGKDRTIWGAMGYVYVCSRGSAIENRASPSFYTNSSSISLAQLIFPTIRLPALIFPIALHQQFAHFTSMIDRAKSQPFTCNGPPRYKKNLDDRKSPAVDSAYIPLAKKKWATCICFE